MRPGTLDPNPYLDPMGREISGPDGTVYTKVNPAYMTRLVHRLGELRSGVLGHITSNTPIKPENAPDVWEREALKQMEQGIITETSELVDMNGKPYLRYMGRLVTDESCLPCHAFQEYKVGDVRGGISVSVPMEPFYKTMGESRDMLWLTHGILWLLGILGIAWGILTLTQRNAERDHAEEELRNLAKELEERVVQRTVALKMSQRQLQTFVDNVEAGVFLKDGDGVFQFANARFAAMFGLSTGAILHRKNTEIFEPSFAQTLDAVEERVKATGEGVEYRHSAKTRAESSESFYFFPVMEEGVAVALGGLVVDMTERDRAEKALCKARDAAERANRAKSDFLANMSHEIRTPLNGVIGVADILLHTNLSTEQASMASAIKASGDALLLVLNDILDLSKVESGKMVLESVPFRLRDILFATARAVSHIAYKKGLDLIVDIDNDIPDDLTGDSTRIRQIVLNLANNALKFTEQGEVRICARLVSRDETVVKLQFVVADTGIGIPLDRQKTIFEAFEQADLSTTRKYGGTGLGLAICGSLLRLMSSTMELESVEGRESRFSFILNLPLAPKTPEPPLPSLQGKHILLADKNPYTVNLLAALLEKAGARVDKVTSVEGFAGASSAKPHDAVVFGQRFLEEFYPELGLVRDTVPDAETAPIVLLAEGLLSPEVHDSFSAVLDKPVRADELVRTLAAEFSGAPVSRILSETVPKSSRPCSILLVEDVALNRLVATHMLDELGHTVTEATNGEGALEILEDRFFDLVFMDVQMPVMDGVTATRKLRERERRTPACRVASSSP